MDNKIQQGSVVMSPNLKKTSERFDKDGRLIESSDSTVDKFEAIKEARAKKLGLK